MTPFLITPEEAAIFLGLSPKTLASWRAGVNKRGPRFARIGGRIQYAKEDLVAWIESQKVDPNAKPEPVLVKSRPPKMAAALRETLNLPPVPRGRQRKATV